MVPLTPDVLDHVGSKHNRKNGGEKIRSNFSSQFQRNQIMIRKKAVLQERNGNVFDDDFNKKNVANWNIELPPLESHNNKHKFSIHSMIDSLP